MTSESSPEPDPRRKRALYVGGAIALAAIAWNYDGFDDHDPVEITIEDSDIRDAGDTIRREIREGVRAGIRGERDEDDGTDDAADDETGAEEEANDAEVTDNETTDGEATEDADASPDDGDSATDDEVVFERTVGDRRIIETRSGANQRSFRIEDDDGDGITISVDAEPAE